jgi:hypothetical protein
VQLLSHRQQTEIPHLIQLSSSRLVQAPELSAAETFRSAVSLDPSVVQRILDEDVRTILIPGLGMSADTVYISRVIQQPVGYSLIGHLNGNSYDSFTLSYANGKVLSLINRASTHHRQHIRNVKGLDSPVLLDIDRGDLDILSCTLDEHEHFHRPVKQPSKKEKSFIPPDNTQSNSEIDVMIVYTPAAVEWASENEMNIETIMNQAMALAQLSFDNSEVAINVNLVHTFEIDYEESGDSGDDLENLTDGKIPSVHEKREQYGADLVAMFTNVDDTGGIAWYMNSTSGDSDYAYSITRVQQAWFTTTHAHEMAHNMGSDHSRNQAKNPAGSGLLFNYSTGWRWTGNDGKVYVSVMTYRNPDDVDPGQAVEVFSNPNVLHQGVPTGSYTGEFAPADNARSLNNMREVIANYMTASGPIVEEPVVSLCEAVGNCDLTFTTGGNAPWFAQAEVLYSGSTAARSGNIRDDQNSWIETTVSGGGELSFYWKVSSEEHFDYLKFVAADTLIAISGNTDWAQVTITVPEGDHTFRWIYEKDESLSFGQDRGWLDAVVFGPLSVEYPEDMASRYVLEQNFPNPFNPATTITFSIPESEFVTLEVYTVTGQVISTLVSEVHPAGTYSVNFDASELSSGVYLYRLTSPSQVITKKMLLMK